MTICPRCAKQSADIHIYTPTDYARGLEAENAALKDITKDVDWEKWHDALEILSALESHQELLTASRALADELAEALEKVIWTQGVDCDDEDCPGDDTCECETPAKVNAALTKYKEALKGENDHA